ncbi:hypothetical protein [Inquilinus sp. OTU3971]|uniref:hypothetical protein n=1 Tax=Inquilinus sp. OTU3971 TaxID=3043855 RepID=UPI00313EF958
MIDREADDQRDGDLAQGEEQHRRDRHDHLATIRINELPDAADDAPVEGRTEHLLFRAMGSDDGARRTAALILDLVSVLGFNGHQFTAGCAASSPGRI